MASSGPSPTVESLLVHADWLRALARCLAANRDEADELVQQTWVAAAESPPDPKQPPRPWLAEVMRNFRRMRLRGAARRRSRERQAADDVSPAVPATDTLLEQLELQRVVAKLLSALEEPYRTAILLRFFQGHPASVIAAEQGVPAGTVRWRLSEGLRRLRARLDEAHGGQRAAWVGVVSAWPEPASLPPAREGLPNAAGKPALGGLLALGLAGGLLCLGQRVLPRPNAGAETTTAVPIQSRAGAPAAPEALSRSQREPITTEDPMMRDKLRKAVALFGIALPALVASADQNGKPLSRDEAISACLEFKERSLACKEELADHFVGKVPPERREKIRAKVLEEIVAEGSGPIEPRRNKCASDVDGKEKGRPAMGILTDRDLAALRACEKVPVCKERIDCSLKIMSEARSRLEP